MSGSPPRSLLITPDLRRRLQQRYEEAQRLAAGSRPNFRRIHELLAECLRADPGNILYVDALLANLRRRGSARSESWWKRLWRRGIGNEPQTFSRSATVPAGHHSLLLSTEDSLLRKIPDALWLRPNDVVVLQNAAMAASVLDFDEVELRYLAAARELMADNADTLKMLARALTRQGRFEDAMGPWFAVLALQPDDSEAERAIEDLRGAVGNGQQVITSDSEHDTAALVRRAQLLQEAGDFATAEKLLAQAQAAAGGDLGLLVLREELRMRHSEQRLEIAKRRAASDSHSKAWQLVERLENEQKRSEIEILNARAERLPGDALVRVELARRLKRAGNYSGAIQRLEEALRLQPDDATALVELGECWQYLRQFPKALEFYERAAKRLESSSDELFKLAHYRAGILAVALAQRGAARDHFCAVLAADPAYKDAQERLDKLGPN
jgi:tetratricopeptide (TPR) repeat protein